MWQNYSVDPGSLGQAPCSVLLTTLLPLDSFLQEPRAVLGSSAEILTAEAESSTLGLTLDHLQVPQPPVFFPAEAFHLKRRLPTCMLFPGLYRAFVCLVTGIRLMLNSHFLIRWINEKWNDLKTAGKVAPMGLGTN